MARSNGKRSFGKRKNKNKGRQIWQNAKNTKISNVDATLLNEVNKLDGSDSCISAPMEEKLYSIVKASSSNDIRNQFIPQISTTECMAAL